MPRLIQTIVIVTGAARGIGLAVAQRFAEDAADVFLADVDPRVMQEADALRAAGHSATAIVGDVSIERDARRVVEIAAATGGVDVLVNNAGMHGGRGDIASLDLDAWDRTLTVNLGSVYLMSKFAMPHLAASRGAIVNMASIVGPIIGTAASLPYGASKAGIVGFTHNLAVQVAPLGVRVNCVCPGSIETELSQKGFAEAAARAGVAVEEAIASFRQTIPLGRFGGVRDVASAVYFLASANASYITGASLVVDGGLSIR